MCTKLEHARYVTTWTIIYQILTAIGFDAVIVNEGLAPFLCWDCFKQQNLGTTQIQYRAASGELQSAEVDSSVEKHSAIL